MPELKDLKAGRKADRQIIAGHFLQVAHKYGAEIDAREVPAHVGFCGPSIELRGSFNGVGFMVDIDDLHERHGSDGGLISWYNASSRAPVRYFSPAFNVAAGDLSQFRPHHKASSVGSWAEMLAKFEAALAVIFAGNAFIEMNEARHAPDA